MFIQWRLTNTRLAWNFAAEWGRYIKGSVISHISRSTDMDEESGHRWAVDGRLIGRSNVWPRPNSNATIEWRSNRNESTTRGLYQKLVGKCNSDSFEHQGLVYRRSWTRRIYLVNSASGNRIGNGDDCGRNSQENFCDHVFYCPLLMLHLCITKLWKYAYIMFTIPNGLACWLNAYLEYLLCAVILSIIRRYWRRGP